MHEQGNLERTWRVREKSGNLKQIAMAVCRKLFILFIRKNDVLSHEIV